jgi:integrase
MPPGLPKYIDAIPAKGRVYYYFRHKGRRVRMNSVLGTPEWHVEYAQHLASLKATSGPRVVAAPQPGTLKALVHEYRQSPDYRKMVPKSQRDYARMIDHLEPLFAFRPIDVKRWHVIKLRNLIAGRSGDRTGDLFVAVCSAIFRVGLDLNYGLEINPCHDIKKLRDDVDSYEPWTAEAVTAFEASEPPEHILTAYMLGRYTSLRLADVLTLSRNRWDGSGFDTSHSKNSAQAYIPAPAPLRSYLEKLPARGLLFVCDERGHAFKERHFSTLWRRHLDRIGLTDFHFHGLRHTAATALADKGASDQEIAAITGHKSASMVRRYTKKAEQKRLAKAAIKKLDE